jgi:hypothetical protein
VRRWVAIDEQKIEGLTSLFASVTEWADRVEWSDRSRLARARKGAEEALAAYRTRLGGLPTTDSFAVGPVTAERIIALRGIELSPKALHDMARTFLGEVRAAIDVLRERLVSKYALPAETTADELHAFLNQRFRLEVNGDFDQVLLRYEKELASIVAFIERRSLFPIFEEQAIRILKTPEFMEPSIPAGAMMSPAPFRDGVRESFIYLTLSEALLDEHTELTIPSMMIHEGIPGHHLQLATASLHESVVRRQASSPSTCSLERMKSRRRTSCQAGL